MPALTPERQPWNTHRGFAGTAAEQPWTFTNIWGNRRPRRAALVESIFHNQDCAWTSLLIISCGSRYNTRACNIISPVKPGLSDIPEPVRDKPLNAPAAFHPSVPAHRRQAASNWDWLGARVEAWRYRLQIHARDGRLRLYTINGADWSKRYPLILEAAARIHGSAIFDAEVWLDLDGITRFDAFHSA
jgi:hypothetical protein